MIWSQCLFLFNNVHSNRTRLKTGLHLSSNIICHKLSSSLPDIGSTLFNFDSSPEF